MHDSGGSGSRGLHPDVLRPQRSTWAPTERRHSLRELTGLGRSRASSSVSSLLSAFSAAHAGSGPWVSEPPAALSPRALLKGCRPRGAGRSPDTGLPWAPGAPSPGSTRGRHGTHLRVVPLPANSHLPWGEAAPGATTSPAPPTAQLSEALSMPASPEWPGHGKSLFQLLLPSHYPAHLPTKQDRVGA